MFPWHLAWATLLAVAQVASTAPPSQHPQQQPHTSTPLSASDISQLEAKAEAGDASAQLALGQAYEDGNGVQENDDLAVKWYRKAAEQGNADAETELGVMYREGRGVEKSKEEALKWYRKAAQQMNAAAMFNLGAAYYNGDGIAINDSLAYAWFLAAEDAGSNAGRDAAARSASELKEYQKIDAYLNLASMYEKGTDLREDLTAVAKWYRAAAEAGNLAARVQLATMMVLGRGVPQDFAQARQWCENAAKEKYSPGAFCLGLIYLQGLGVAKNPAQAAKWFNRAVEQGHVMLTLYLGEMYWKGEGLDVNKEKAYSWMLVAANAGIPKARQDVELLKKELDSRQLKRADKNAMRWERQHLMPALRDTLNSPN